MKAGAKGCGQTAHYLLAEGQDGAIIGALPLSEIRSPLFGAAMVSTGFGVDGGVLGEGVDALAEAAWGLVGEKGIESVELRGGPVPDGWTGDADSYLGFVRPIAGDDEAEMKVIPRKQRAELPKALAQDLEVVTGREPQMLAEHYRVYAESVRNLLARLTDEVPAAHPLVAAGLVGLSHRFGYDEILRLAAAALPHGDPA